MKSLLLGAVLAAVILPALSARPIAFHKVPGKLGESHAHAVYEAKAALASDEVLVVREVMRRANGEVLLADAIYSAIGMDASYRVLIFPLYTPGWRLEYLATTTTITLPLHRTKLTETKLEVVFHNADSTEWTHYAWFARVENLGEVLRRYPGFTPAKKPFLGAVSNGSRFHVAWERKP